MTLLNQRYWGSRDLKRRVVENQKKLFPRTSEALMRVDKLELAKKSGKADPSSSCCRMGGGVLGSRAAEVCCHCI